MIRYARGCVCVGLARLFVDCVDVRECVAPRAFAVLQLTVELYHYSEIQRWTVRSDGTEFVFWVDDSHAIVLFTNSVRSCVLVPLCVCVFARAAPMNESCVVVVVVVGSRRMRWTLWCKSMWFRTC